MKKLFTFILGLGMVAAANAQMTEGARARVYAYDLQQEETTAVVDNETVKAYTFTFKTNTAANEDAKVILFAEGQNDVVVTATPTDNTNKSWTATVTGATAGLMTADYNWKVEVSALAVESFQMISDHSTPNFTYFRSYGVAVDQSPESDYFGRVYATNSKEGTTGPTGANRKTTFGIYTYNADLTVQNGGNANSCDIIGTNNSTDIESTGGNRPNNIVVSNDGYIYAAVRETSLSGVYRIDPADFSYTNIFEGTLDSATGVITDESGNTVASVPNALGVRGDGENMQIFTINRNPTYLTSTSQYQVFRRYDIGTAEVWNKKPSWEATMLGKSDYHANNVQVINDFAAIAPVSTGFWGSQYRGTTSASNPSLFYANNSGKVEFSAEGTLSLTPVNTKNTAVAVNEELGLVAHLITSPAQARVFKYTIENGVVNVDADAVATYTLTDLGNLANGLAFDYAGNLYAVASQNSNKEFLGVYALPLAENRRTTPAKSSLVATFDKNDLATSVEKVGVDASAPVEYYNLQGVKVENPANGIFIRKQGSKTTKVVL